LSSYWVYVVVTPSTVTVNGGSVAAETPVGKESKTSAPPTPAPRFCNLWRLRSTVERVRVFFVFRLCALRIFLLKLAMIKPPE
jgi:hypothetical protein